MRDRVAHHPTELKLMILKILWHESPKPAWQSPMMVYLEQTAGSATLTVKADGPSGTRPVTEIALHLKASLRVEIQSGQIVRKDGSTTMSIEGRNLDLRAIKSATNKAQLPLVRQLIMELEALGLSTFAPSTNTSDIPIPPPQPGQAEMLAGGQAIDMLGDKQQAERIARIVALVEALADKRQQFVQEIETHHQQIQQQLRELIDTPIPRQQTFGDLRFPIEVERAMMGDQVLPRLPQATPHTPTPSLQYGQLEDQFEPLPFPIDVELGKIMQSDQPKR